MEIGGLRHGRVATNAIELHYVEAGRGAPVMLLHGFPDFWYSWRLQIPVLAEAGYRVIAPDLPGYNESDKPRPKTAYAVPALLEDIERLIERTAEVRVVLVGHDWGGVLAWWLAARRPDLVRRLVILNAPHPEVYQRALRTSSQLLKSWYAFFFQLPWLPERMIRALDFALLERVFRRETYRADAFTEEDIARYKRALAKPGALRAAINYYRMVPRLLRRKRESRLPARVSVPTLVIWGERDPHLDLKNLVGLEHWVPDLRIERFAEAGHWVHRDATETVNHLLVTFGRA